MKYAVMADIHGNCYALETCIKKIEEIGDIGAIICLGDYITDIPKSHEVIERLRQLEQQYTMYCVRGNREDYILEYHNHPNKRNLFNIMHTYQQLQKSDMDFIQSLPEEMVIKDENGYLFYLSHKMKEDSSYAYNIFGHDHEQTMSTIENKKFINPGSVGMPIHLSHIGANFATIETNQEGITIIFYNIVYDGSEVIDTIQQDLIYTQEDKWGVAVIEQLKTGRNFTLDYAMECRCLLESYQLEETPENIVKVSKEARKNLKLE